MRVPPILLLLCATAEALQGQAASAACLPTPRAEPGGSVFDLPASVGTIRLPPLTTVEPLGTNPDGRKFILGDSTVLEIWVTKERLGGLAAAGVTGAPRPETCETRISSFDAMVTRVGLAAAGGDSVYLGLLSITLRADRFLNVAVTTAIAPSRDVVLSAVAGYLTLR